MKSNLWQQNTRRNYKELLDKLPEEGEEAIYENIYFKVTKVTKNRIERITVTINETETVTEQ